MINNELETDALSRYHKAKIGVYMIRITICDDNKVFAKLMRTKLRAILESNGIAAEIHVINSAEQLSDVLITSGDIFFLDIDFDKKPYNGIDIAKNVRQVRQDAVIIFVSNYIEFAPAGYELQAFRYILKKDLDKKLKNSLLDAVKLLQIEQSPLEIWMSGDLCRLPTSEIVYMEAQSHYVSVYVRKKNQNNLKIYKCHTSLSCLEKQLASQGFLRIQKSYLVNMNHLKKFQCNQAVLDDGKLLPVSEKNYAARKQEYLKWKGLK